MTTETVYTGTIRERPRIAPRTKTRGRVAEERIAELTERADALDAQGREASPKHFEARAEAARQNADELANELAGQRREATLTAASLGDSLAKSQAEILAHLAESTALIEAHNALDVTYRETLAKCRSLGANVPEAVVRLTHRIGTNEEDRAIRRTLADARRAGLPL